MATSHFREAYPLVPGESSVYRPHSVQAIRCRSDPQQRLDSPSVAGKGVKTPHSVDASFNMDSAHAPRNGALNALADERAVRPKCRGEGCRWMVTWEVGVRHDVNELAIRLAMMLARELTGASYPRIGRAFDGRNHATVLSNIRRWHNLVDMLPELYERRQAVLLRLGLG